MSKLTRERVCFNHYSVFERGVLLCDPGSMIQCSSYIQLSENVQVIHEKRKGGSLKLSLVYWAIYGGCLALVSVLDTLVVRYPGYFRQIDVTKRGSSFCSTFSEFMLRATLRLLHVALLEVKVLETTLL